MKNITDRVPINDLLRLPAPALGELAAVTARVIERGQFVLGNCVEEFERSFADYCGSAHCVGVGNGTDALEISLRVLGCGRGDEVITVANAGAFSSVAIFAVGASPVYVDIEEDSGLIDPDTLAAAMGPATKAIIVTHLYGKLADMDEISPIAKAAGIPIIEDAAQAHGARRRGQHAGSWGVLGCFSFYPTKNLGALGDGGAIVASDDVLANRVRAMRQYGWTARFQAGHPGGRNSRLDEIQAAVLSEKLPHLEAQNARRRSVADYYRSVLSDLPIGLPEGGEDHVFHRLVVRHPERDRLRSELAQRGIDTDIHYPLPDYRHPGFHSSVGGTTALPRTEKFMAEILTLPCFPGITDAELDRVTGAIIAALGDEGAQQ